MKKLSIILAILMIATFAIFAMGSVEDESSTAGEETEISNTDNEINESPKENSTEENVKETEEEAETEPEPELSIGQKNALKSAQSYLNFTAFSYSGLIEQLEFEGYTTEEATFAADNCGADWFEQAAKSAESYLEYMAFSKEGLIEQLEFEGFTREQAEYGAQANGY